MRQRETIFIQNPKRKQDCKLIYLRELLRNFRKINAPSGIIFNFWIYHEESNTFIENINPFFLEKYGMNKEKLLNYKTTNMVTCFKRYVSLRISMTKSVYSFFNEIGFKNSSNVMKELRFFMFQVANIVDTISTNFKVKISISILNNFFFYQYNDGMEFVNETKEYKEMKRRHLKISESSYNKYISINRKKQNIKHRRSL